MCRLSLLLAVLVVLPLLGSDSPKEYDGAMVDELEGSWRLTKHWINGEPRNPFEYHVHRFHNGTYAIHWSGGDVWQGSYRIHPTRNPPQLDCFPSNGYFKGETLRFIYQLDGDTLKIAGKLDKQRPPGFNDEHVEVWTYKRAK